MKRTFEDWHESLLDGHAEESLQQVYPDLNLNGSDHDRILSMITSRVRNFPPPYTYMAQELLS